MPARYEKMGIHFRYPENWTLDEQDAVEGNRSVTLFGPQGAFWSITQYSLETPPKELLDSAIATMREEYPDMDAEPFEEKIRAKKVYGCEMNFYCLDLTNTAWFRTWRASDATYLVYCQAEDRQLAALAEVFAAVTTSLFDP